MELAKWMKKVRAAKNAARSSAARSGVRAGMSEPDPGMELFPDS
jgi:hypothetical protein